MGLGKRRRKTRRDKQQTREKGQELQKPCSLSSRVAEKVDRVLKKYGVTTAMRPHATLRRLLVHPRRNLEPEERCELVYQIRCKICGAACIGETGRLFKSKLNENKKDVENAQKEQHTRSEKKWSQSTTNKSALTVHDQQVRPHIPRPTSPPSHSTTNKSALTVHDQQVRPHSPRPTSPPSQSTTNKSALTVHDQQVRPHSPRPTSPPSHSTTNSPPSQSTTNKSALTVHDQQVRPHSPRPTSPPPQSTTNKSDLTVHHQQVRPHRPPTNKSALTVHTTTENHFIDWEEVKVVDRESHRSRHVKEAIGSHTGEDTSKRSSGYARPRQQKTETRAISNFFTCRITSSNVISTYEVALIRRRKCLHR